MTTSRGQAIHQLATHTQLIRRGKPSRAQKANRPALDAIVVPAARPASYLEHAISLAKAVRCQLVILCSRDAKAVEVCDLFASLSFDRGIAIEIPGEYTHDEFFTFETTTWIKEKLPDACAVRDSDLSIKRNVGLVLARLLGWQRIFFLDDDIKGLDAAALLSTSSLLGHGKSLGHSYRTAGIPVKEFPDNSVVCHARRAIGQFQDVFVSGSALAVDCTAPFGFFPDIYNEDWLFFYQDAAERKLGSSDHQAGQLTYDPFANPRRAAGEEFGDVIAEGLYALLEENMGAEQANVDRWRQFLSHRYRIIQEIIDKAEKVPGNIRENMVGALETAQRCLEEIQPEMCVDYLEHWREDLKRWEIALKEIPRVRSIQDALARLDLTAATARVSARPNLFTSRLRPPRQHRLLSMRRGALEQPAAAELTGTRSM